MFAFVFLLLIAPVQTDDPLAAARQANREARWEDALELLEAALAGNLPSAHAIEAHELLATTHLSMGDRDAAKREFVEILRLQNSYQPPSHASPKLWRVFKAARRAAADDAPQPEPEREPPAAQPTPQIREPSGSSPTAVSGDAWYRQWWVWTAVGVVAAGIVAGVVAYSVSDPGPPPGNFGPDRL